MISKIAIEVTDHAFLPEAYAYRDYFQGLGYFCEFVEKGSEDVLSYDAVVLFHGFHPFWKKYPRFIIGEYHSLSTGRLCRAKDFLKRLLNVRSDFYIFLNESVRARMWHSQALPHAIRGMGFDKKQLALYKNEQKLYDVVYSGSFRKGVIEKVEYLASLGLKVAVVGFSYHADNPNIKNFGRVSPKESWRIITQARVGLNYTPDIFPLNIQDSTKVIEYCGAGLGVITNRYIWIDNFERKRNGRFLDYSSIKSLEDVKGFEFIVPDVSDLSWDKLTEEVYRNLKCYFFDIFC